MTQEERQLLLKDLCARLLYGIKVLADIDKVFDGGCIGIVSKIELYTGNRFPDLKGQYLLYLENSLTPLTVDEVRPYLRPMSSMTEEEGKEFNIITNGEKGFYEDEDGWVRCDNIHTKWGVWPKGCAEMIDWLNSHHFDYRGLIPMGLALEAPEGMYKE